MVRLAAIVLRCVKDFNALFRTCGCILRFANLQSDLKNVFCVTEIADVTETSQNQLCAPLALWLVLRKNLRDLHNCIPITVRGWNSKQLLDLSEVTDRLHLPSIKAQNKSVLNRDDLDQPVVI